MSVEQEAAYDPELFIDSDVPKLTLRDANMLAVVIDDPDKAIDQDFIDKLNAIIDETSLRWRRGSIGSSFIPTDMGSPSETVKRQAFYRELGWLEPKHVLNPPLNIAFQGTSGMPAPKRLISNLRALYEYSEDELLPILKHSCRVLGALSSRLRHNLYTLDNHGINPLYTLLTNPKIVEQAKNDRDLIAGAEASLRNTEKRAAADARKAVGRVAYQGQNSAQARLEIPEHRRQAITELANIMGVDPTLLEAAADIWTNCDDKRFTAIQLLVQKLTETSDEPIALRQLLFAIRNEKL